MSVFLSYYRPSQGIDQWARTRKIFRHGVSEKSPSTSTVPFSCRSFSEIVWGWNHARPYLEATVTVSLQQRVVTNIMHFTDTCDWDQNSRGGGIPHRRLYSYSRPGSKWGQVVKLGIGGSTRTVKISPGDQWAWLMLNNWGSRPDFQCGQGVKNENLMDQPRSRVEVQVLM